MSFTEMFADAAAGGLSVFGLTLDLMSEHIVNYLRRLPEDMCAWRQMLGAH